MSLRKSKSAKPGRVSRVAALSAATALTFFAGTVSSSMTPATVGASAFLQQAPALAQDAPSQYTVQEGDTLWDIASTFLQDPWFWPEIWYVNPEIINPHLIYPGDVLALVYIDGQPRVTTAQGSSLRLSPSARATPLVEAVTTIPFESIRAFLSAGRVMEKREAEKLPHIVAVRGEGLLAATGNDVYVRGIDDPELGSRYSVVSFVDELRDPENNKLMGYHGLWIAEGTIRRGGDPATMELTASNREARKGHRLLPSTVELPLNFYPKPPDAPIDGRIMAVVDGVSQIGQWSVVIVNRGSDDGLAQGDVLRAFKYGQTIRDRIGGGKVRLPDEEAGTVMIFKTYEEIAYGLVMEATEPLHVADAVRNPS